MNIQNCYYIERGLAKRYMPWEQYAQPNMKISTVIRGHLFVENCHALFYL